MGSILFFIIFIIFWFKYSDRVFNHLGISDREVYVMLFGAFIFDAINGLSKVFAGQVSDGLIELAINSFIAIFVYNAMNRVDEPEETETDS